ncbi:cistern family PEP-CTERM protein [Erythrobacter sp. Alg231-14]|uniref:cistern family PEP-CTERM protein n=1 Tax=Erythrobacter sp. Alg231-14 TaxID=1922225 RepID=UPI00307C73B9
MMEFLSKSVATLAAAMGIGLSAPAAAEPILLDGNTIGEDFVISFDGFVDGGPALDGLSGQLELTLNSIVNGVYNFDYSLTNTGATGDAVSSRISSFAFNTDPEIVGADSTGAFSFSNLDRNFPNGIGRVDVCFLGSDTNSCAGGGSGGVLDGNTGAGTLSLDFGGAIAALTLDDFFVRYQSIDGIDGVTSASGREVASSTSSGGTDVPAPGMLLILAVALAALFFPRQLFSQQRKVAFPIRNEVLTTSRA